VELSALLKGRSTWRANFNSIAAAEYDIAAREVFALHPCHVDETNRERIGVKGNT
jgi:hypothetical protein